MRLIHCQKCGTAIVTEDAFVERMQDAVHELNEKARKTRNNKNAQSYIREASSITKMMKGILHNTAQMTDRKLTCQLEMCEIVYYLRKNNLISDEKLDELRETARKKAEARNSENEKEIQRIYADYHSIYNLSNRTKADLTAERAVTKAGRDGY